MRKTAPIVAMASETSIANNGGAASRHDKGAGHQHEGEHQFEGLGRR